MTPPNQTCYSEDLSEPATETWEKGLTEGRRGKRRGGRLIRRETEYVKKKNKEGEK